MERDFDDEKNKLNSQLREEMREFEQAKKEEYELKLERTKRELKNKNESQTGDL